jgi:hypothetical protein
MNFIFSDQRKQMEVGQTGEPMALAVKTAEQETNSAIEHVLILVQALKDSNAMVFLLSRLPAIQMNVQVLLYLEFS